MSRRLQKGGPSAADKIAAREEVLDALRELLAQGNKTVHDVREQMNLSRSTAYAYLLYLEGIDEAHRTGVRDEHGREPWAAGPAPVPEGEEVVEADGCCAWIVPARQMGMQRDPLVAALFGPARGGAA